MASTIPKPSIEYSRVRNIIRNDYYSYLDGSTNLFQKETINFLREHEIRPTAEDPFVNENIQQVYERVFGRDDFHRFNREKGARLEPNKTERYKRITRDEQMREMLSGRMIDPKTLNNISTQFGNPITLNQIENISKEIQEFNPYGRAPHYDVIDSFTRTNTKPSLHDLLSRNLPREAIDIIGETGEQYELNIAEALGFIIDMYRQFRKRGENKTISDINVELSKMKEDVNGHESDVEKHKQRVKRFRGEEEMFPPG